MDCLFCKIIDKQIPSNIVYTDEQVIAFDDIAPQAPIHKLIIPRKHIATLNDLSPADSPLIAHMLQTAKTLTQALEVEEAGYRLVFNCNRHGGQEVFHIHLHLLAGRQLQWPPG
jgi:histidine triad (HIT) family protein